MRVERSKVLGFCAGVRTAVDLAEQCARLAQEQNVPFYCIGSLIHNRNEVHRLEEMGMRVISSPDEGQAGIALIRAHGITDSLRRDFKEKGFTLVDGTCKNIKITRKKIYTAAIQGKFIVIIGKPTHGETKALVGTEIFPGVNASSIVIDDVSKVSQIPQGISLFIASQTTFSEVKHKEIMDEISKNFDDIEIANKLCLTCFRRRRAALKLTETCDAVLVVGDSHSENTTEIFKTISNGKVPIWQILDETCIPKEISRFETVGVCSGSSTPPAVTDKVVAALEAL